MSALTDALIRRERDYRAALEAIDDTSETPRPAYWDLREAVALVGCLRRLCEGRTVAELHRAFGAPGDFGYENPIGAALAEVYGLIQPEGAT